MSASHDQHSKDHHSQNHNSQSLFFRMLPQEIRDKIYIEAFDMERKTSKTIDKRAWVMREKSARGRDRRLASYGSKYCKHYAVRPFPGCPFDDFLVSKRFYEEAAKAWLHTVTLDFEDQEKFASFVCATRPSLISAVTTVHLHWRRHLTIFSEFANLKACTGLRTLRVTVHDIFTAFEDKIEYVDDLGEEEFEQLSCIKDFTAARSLQSVVLISGEHDEVATEEELRQWRKNIAALNDYIMLRIGESRRIDLEYDRLLNQVEPHTSDHMDYYPGGQEDFCPFD